VNIILFGPPEEMLKQAYPAFVANGFPVAAVVDTVERLKEICKDLEDAIAVIKLDVFNTRAEAEEALQDLDCPKIIVAPIGWESTNIPNATTFNHANWPEIVEAVKFMPRPQPQPAPPPPPPTTPTKKARIRIGFYGQRGGVGVTTACVEAAKLLAKQGIPVTLCDATNRGDIHLMLGLEPKEEPLRVGIIQVKMGLPNSEEEGAVIVDGGRKAWGKNIKWVELSGPLSEEALRKILGLEEKGKKAVTLPKVRIEFV